MGIAVVFALSFFLPIQAHAEQETDWLLHGAKEDLTAISQEVKPLTQELEQVPLAEIQLSPEELEEIKTNFPDVRLYKNKQYSVAGATATPVATKAITYPKRFIMMNTTPEAIAPYTGKGVRVGVVDSGIDVKHSKLNVKGGVCALPKLQCAFGEFPYNDDLGHGTHVAGILSSTQATNGTMGIAPGVDLFAIKTINAQDSGSTIDIVAGIDWAITNKMDILNMSITTASDDPALRLMLEKAYATGMIIVASAGNTEFGAKQDDVQYPAKYPTVIAATAIKTATKERYKYASIGPEVELAAPGVDIFSTYPRILDNDGQKDGYTMLSGTSMASPHVSGIAALLKQRFPKMTNIQLRAKLVDAAEDLGAQGRDREFGYGLVRYPQKLDEIPIMSQYTEKSKVVFELSNVNQTAIRQIKIEEREIPEQSPGKWETYLLSGTHKGTYAIKTKTGKQVQEEILVKVDGVSYKDIGSRKWYGPQIAYLTTKEFIYGFNGNLFKPDQNITRAEAVAIMGRAKGLNGEKRQTKFPDVGPRSSASGYIQSAVENEILIGFPDGTFRPDQPVSRGEMALLLQEAFILPYDDQQNVSFKDMTPKVASYEAAMALAQAGVTKGFLDGTFKPQEAMTRSTYSVFLAGAENSNLFN